MKVALCHSHLIGSYGIRWMTFSDVSHSAIVDDDWVIEAVWPRVRCIPLADFLAERKGVKFIDIDLPDEWKALQWAYEQVGKKYDKWAVLGWVMHRDWQKDDAWDCAEYVATAAKVGGRLLFREGSLSRVTPQHLWMLPP